MVLEWPVHIFPKSPAVAGLSTPSTRQLHMQQLLQSTMTREECDLPREELVLLRIGVFPELMHWQTEPSQ